MNNQYTEAANQAAIAYGLADVELFNAKVAMDEAILNYALAMAQKKVAQTVAIAANEAEKAADNQEQEITKCTTCGDAIEEIQWAINGECAYYYEKRIFSYDESNIGFADARCDC